MADVVVLPGVERRDLCGPELPSAEILQSAIDQGISDVVIIGRHRDGELYVAGVHGDIDRTVGVLMRAVQFLTSGDFHGGIFEKPKDPT